MNPQAEEALTNLLTLAVDGLEGAKDFAQAEVPSVVNQLLLWEFWIHLLGFGASIACIVAIHPLVVRAKRARRDARKAYERGEKWTRHYEGYSATSPQYDAILWCIPHGLVIFAAAAVGTSLANLTWLKIWIAPKLYLLEYAADLTK